MLGKKRFGTGKVKPIEYDISAEKPILRCSICTGEQVAGLKDHNTGKFREIMVIRSKEDLEYFQKMVGTKDIAKEY